LTKVNKDDPIVFIIKGEGLLVVALESLAVVSPLLLLAVRLFVWHRLPAYSGVLG